MTTRNKLLGMVLLSVASVTSVVWATVGGLTSGFGKVIVENLQPGVTYRLSDLYQKIAVTNTGDLPVRLAMEVVRPNPDDVKDEGFEPIPDVRWAFLEKSELYIEPWADGMNDLVLRIPDEEKYRGKKYQLHVWSHTEGEKRVSSIAVGLSHKLLFTVAVSPDKDAKAKSSPKNSSFAMEPFEIHLSTVPLFDKVNVGKWSKRSLVVKNPQDKPHRFRIWVLRPEDLREHGQKGYEAVAPSHVTFAETEFTVPARGEKTVDVSFRLPASRSLLKSKVMFVVRAAMLDGDIPFMVDSRIYATTVSRFQRRWIQEAADEERREREEAEKRLKEQAEEVDENQ